MERVIKVGACMGMDSLARVINTIRRGKVQVLEISSKLGSNGDINIVIRVRGEESEIEWLRKKILVLVDVTSVEVL
ncbi:hypothetical protein ATG_09370 [Desulfurococcaceae archaeon AG1]|nr:hypothetical protein ATG_09370 [Desulfurococcaceae archaeon AG1]